MAGTQRSNIEVFFTVSGAARVKKAFQDLERQAAQTALRAPRAGFDLVNTVGRRSIAGVTSLIRNLGGVAPVISGAWGATKRLYDGLKSSVVAATALAGAGYGVGRAFASIYDSTAELTSVVLALRAVNNEVRAAGGLPRFAPASDGPGLVDVMSGGAAKAAKDLQFLNQVAHEHGISIRELGKDYATLKASSIGSAVSMQDVARVTEAIADAALVLGRTPSEVHRANIALGQIASKGQVYAEELKGQLAEAIPGALPIAARAYGVTVAKFNKMVADGLVDSASFFAKFSRQLKTEYGAAAKSAANTTRVAAGQLANAWFNAKVLIGSGDLDKMFRRILQSVTRLFNLLSRNGSFSRFGANLAKAMEPLVKRFEDAVNGGYDFNRVLNGLVSVFRGLVGAVNLALDVFGELSRAFGAGRQFLRNYGFEIPSIADGMRNLATTVRQVSEVLLTRKFSGNGFADFLAAAYTVIESIAFALGRLIFPKGFTDGAQTLSDRLERAANWLAQLAAAINTLSTGKVDPFLDDTGEGILVTLTLALDRIRQFRDGVKEAIALLSGAPTPENADLQTKKRFATRDKFADLLTGKPNSAKEDDKGNELVAAKDYEVLFKARNMLVEIVKYLDENKDTLKSFFTGAVDAMKGVLDVGEKIAKVLRFLGINDSVAYLAGMFFILSKILPLGRIFKSLFSVTFLVIKETFIYLIARAGGIKTVLSGLGSAIATSAKNLGKNLAGFGKILLGVFTNPQFLVIAVILGLIAFLVFQIVSNWKLLKAEIGNVITIIKAGLTHALAVAIRGIADLLAYIPVVGGSIKKNLYGYAEDLDKGAVEDVKAANAKSAADAKARRDANGGKDPVEGSAADGLFDFKAFGAGFKEMMSDIFGDEKDPVLDRIAQKAAADQAKLSKIDQQLAGSFQSDRNGLDVGNSYIRPVEINIEGVSLDLRGQVRDPKIDELAARAAQNRASMTPAWGN